MKLHTLVLLALLLNGCARNDPAAADAPIRIHFDYLGSCTRLLGNEGGYLVFQIRRIDNGTEESFLFEPQHLRFIDGNAQEQVPLLVVPEFSDIEVPGQGENASQETYLLQYRDAQTLELARKVITYARNDVRMVPTDANTVEQSIDCDQYAT